MRLDLAVLKVAKYGVSTGGDTVEVTERPAGGLTAVIVDGQGSGPAAKNISSSVATKAIALIAEGVRDGAAARAVNDYLYSHRRAKVQASMAILSADLLEGTLVFSRNTASPGIFVAGDGRVETDEEEAPVIGVHRMVRPRIRQVPLEAGAALVTFTDGVSCAGRGAGARLGLAEIVQLVQGAWPRGAEAMARSLLERALAADRGRPADDMTVAVLKAEPLGEEGPIREMRVSYPVPAAPGVR